VPARLPSDLLSRSAEEASRLVALAFLDETARAANRLGNPSDAEALHDFRVGLRRLRSCFRAYRPQLESSVSRKTRRRLRALTTTTNVGRDTEVQLDWLHRQISRLNPDQVPGLAWMIGRLEGRRGTQEIGNAAPPKFNKAAAKLRSRLRTFQAEVRVDRGSEAASFGQVTGELIRQHSDRLAEQVRMVQTSADKAHAHRARIAAKRLRYLLEPLSRRAPGVKTLVKSLKGLQDQLGELHDMQVLSEELESTRATLSRVTNGGSGSIEPGLIALRQLADQHAGEAFASFGRTWGRDRNTTFFRRTEELSGRLLHPASVPDESPMTSQVHGASTLENSLPFLQPEPETSEPAVLRRI
jgi:CHAD domain-containing protein